MKFGTKKSEAAEFDSDGMYLRNFKDGDTKVRFLQEVDDWIEFREHYTADRRSYPCTLDKATCPGCTSDSDDERTAKRKYAANLLVVKGNFVAPFRIPASLAKKMETRSERNEGTVLTRDYVVIRSGKNLDTEYDVESDDTYKVDTAKLLREDGLDIEEVLARSFDENAPVDGRPKERAKKDDEDEKPKRRAKAEPEPEPEADEELPTDAEDQSESAVPSVVIDEDELIDMAIGELRSLAKKAGVALDDGERKSGIIRKIVAASK
jgi:hypothetical protein